MQTGGRNSGIRFGIGSDDAQHREKFVTILTLYQQVILTINPQVPGSSPGRSQIINKPEGNTEAFL
jgi:hypothetical protein